VTVGRYQAYPEYKDSGLDWVGPIPSGWTLNHVKHVAPFQVGWTPPTKSDANFDGENLWANISDLKNDIIYDTAKRVSDNAVKSAGMTITPKGSLLYSFKLSVGTVSFAGKDMFTNEAIASFLDHAQLPLDYLFYALPEFVIKNASTNIYGAAILNQELIRDAYLLAPTYNEAEQIAAFLDHETAKIDRLIEKQQALISLLKEKRQAVISHAVTKGLNPHVSSEASAKEGAPLKDSGNPWLGQVPAHWKTLRVKTVSTFLTSGPRGWSERVGDEGALFIQSGDLNDLLEIKYGTAKRVLVGNDAETDRTRLIEGDVVVCITGAKTGNVAVAESVPETAFINQHLCLVRPDTNISPAFLGSFLKGRIGQTYFELSQYGLKQGLSLEDVKEAPVVLPPLDEQAAIVEYLRTNTSKFDAIIQEALEAVTLLQERRTALISAAVTGKIDVRHWQPPTVSKMETVEPAAC